MSFLSLMCAHHHSITSVFYYIRPFFLLFLILFSVYLFLHPAHLPLLLQLPAAGAPPSHFSFAYPPTVVRRSFTCAPTSATDGHSSLTRLQYSVACPRLRMMFHSGRHFNWIFFENCLLLLSPNHSLRTFSSLQSDCRRKISFNQFRPFDHQIWFLSTLLFERDDLRFYPCA